LSAVFGSNVTLADGYAIGSQANFSNFEPADAVFIFCKLEINSKLIWAFAKRNPISKQNNKVNFFIFNLFKYKTNINYFNFNVNSFLNYFSKKFAFNELLIFQ
jgi:hypothetical protein